MRKLFLVVLAASVGSVMLNMPVFGASCCGGAECQPKDADANSAAASGLIAATVYSCPMHPEVTSDKPGKCPKCGMDLVRKEPADGGKYTVDGGKCETTDMQCAPQPNSGISVLYQCPMDPGVTSDKPGKCPKCGMNLEKIKN